MSEPGSASRCGSGPITETEPVYLLKRDSLLGLTRRVGEGILITGDIQITVLAISGSRVRLGIAAPESIRVDRREVCERRSEFAAGLGGPEVAPAR